MADGSRFRKHGKFAPKGSFQNSVVKANNPICRLIKKFWRHDRLSLGLGSLAANTMEEKKAR